MSHVCIVDSGGANIASIGYALERLGASASLTSSAAELAHASHVILPGVGAAGNAMGRLREHGLVDAIRGLKVPVLGICLGMQLLYESSAEGDTTCLGLIRGRAERLVAPGLSVPHMGWNTCTDLRASPLFHGITSADHMYFVHSYALPLTAETLATAEHGQRFAAAVQARNFFGVQFHPERSAQAGARLLRNFLSIAPGQYA